MCKKLALPQNLGLTRPATEKVKYLARGRVSDPGKGSEEGLKHVLLILEAWVESQDILPELQKRFRGGNATMDQCLMLQLMIEKYVKARS